MVELEFRSTRNTRNYHKICGSAFLFAKKRYYMPQGIYINQNVTRFTIGSN